MADLLTPQARRALSLILAYHVTAVSLSAIPDPYLESSGLSSLIRFITYPYAIAGLKQKWDMFASPPTEDHYLRLTYRIVSPTATRQIQEIVLPSDPDDRLRLRHDFRDKAIINAIELSYSRTSRDDASDDLGAVVQYYRNRARDQFLKPGERIVRTEAWYGSAPMPQPGARLPETELRERLGVLDAYYAGDGSSLSQSPPSDSREREADIVWTLIYAEES
jgi:hypothetical protein